jgi:hypothetical protein
MFRGGIKIISANYAANIRIILRKMCGDYLEINFD